MESTRGGTKQLAIVERMVPLGFNVLRFDFSYVGDSEGDYEDLTVSGEVGDALGALDFMGEFGATDCTLVGSSLGGLVALLAASQAAHAVSRVATIAAVADTRLFTETLTEKAIADWRRRGRHRIGSSFLKPSFLDDVLRIDAPSAFSRITMPLLVMHGDADTVVPASHAQIIAASVCGPVRVEMFPGVGHRFEEPGALGRLLDLLEGWVMGEGTEAEMQQRPAGAQGTGPATQTRVAEARADDPAAKARASTPKAARATKGR